MERLTVTVMNRALAGKENCLPEQWFQVQSEREVWPVAMFEVKKECHAVLKRYLTPSMLNETIKRHNNGETLSVKMDDGSIDTFKVEWHAAGDLKTLKCMNNCPTGAGAKFCCLYCMDEREPFVVKGAKGSKTRKQWKGGVMKCRNKSSWGQAPDRDRLDPDWDAVLDIPLCRVHICTMHCENRMVE
eukprot:5535773-Pyramimonas_sp.AAC.1